MKATEQYFPVVLFILLYMVALTFESVDEILKCDHSNESYRAVLSCCTVYSAIHGGSNFWVCGWNPKVWPFKWRLLSSTFLWYGAVYYAVRGASTLKPVNKVVKCDYSNESYWAVLSFGAFYEVVQATARPYMLHGMKRVSDNDW